MDGSRFDGWTRALATGVTRRQTLRGIIAGGTLAGLLGHAGLDAAACVKPGKKGCRGPRHRTCCDGARCQGGTATNEGRCVCTGDRKQCGTTCVNPKTDTMHCGRCNKKCAAGHTCKRGTCTSPLGCRAGKDFCQGSSSGQCPNSSDRNCHCVTDVEDIPRCVKFVGLVCSTCTTNAECGTDRACMDTATVRCETSCPDKACVPANCDGVA